MKLVSHMFVLGLSAILGLSACGEQKTNQENVPVSTNTIVNNSENMGTEHHKQEKKSKENTKPIEPVDINTATAQELIVALKGTGVGKAKVEKIIEYREQNKGFKSIDELNQVKGIGDKTLEKMRSRVKISNVTTSYNNEPKSVKPATDTK